MFAVEYSAPGLRCHILHVGVFLERKTAAVGPVCGVQVLNADDDGIGLAPDTSIAAVMVAAAGWQRFGGEMGDGTEGESAAECIAAAAAAKDVNPVCQVLSLARDDMSPSWPSARTADELGQKLTRAGELARQVYVDHVVKSPFRERLLLGANPHLKQLLNCGDPLRVSRDEGIVAQRILRTLNISRCKRMGRILKTEIDDVLRCDS